jgi:hypothetical protein
VTRQERAAAFKKTADEQFEVILAKSKELVRANQEKRDKSWKRPEGMSKPAFKVACAVRVLRESGVAWWSIAQALGLPGAGDSANTGKSGASKARRLYTDAFGTLPEVRATSKGAATKVAQVAGSFFSPEVLDEVVAGAVLGKKLVWQVRIGDIRKEDEAVVSPMKAHIIETPSGRAVRFNSIVHEGNTWVRGPERTVLVSRIMQVSAGVPAGLRV